MIGKNFIYHLFISYYFKINYILFIIIISFNIKNRIKFEWNKKLERIFISFIAWKCEGI
jgi:hypothetical protein